jgi:hypothetical protein
MKQEERNNLAVKISKLLNKEIPRPNIFDCLDILNNLQEQFIKELEFNFTKAEREINKVENKLEKWKNKKITKPKRVDFKFIKKEYRR